MPGFIDMTGKVFARLTVIGFAGMNKNGSALWNCRCSCGSEKVILGHAIRSGNTRSCGCYNREARIREMEGRRQFSPRDAAIRIHLRAYKKGARDRQLAWELTDAEFLQITARDCYYCAASPAEVCQYYRRGNGDYFANGIDRLDNALGYTVANSVPCCSSCNQAKRSKTPEEFVARCVAVAGAHGQSLTTPAHWFKRGARFAQRAA